MKNTGISGVARRYLLRIIFYKVLQINNNIPCLLAAQKQIIFRLKFLCARHLKIKHFELFPRLQRGTHLMSYISRWLLLVSVILQISNLEAILYSGHFFYTPCIVSYTPRSIICHYNYQIPGILETGTDRTLSTVFQGACFSGKILKIKTSDMRFSANLGIVWYGCNFGELEGFDSGAIYSEKKIFHLWKIPGKSLHSGNSYH